MKIHNNLTQGSPEWMEARRGIITASEVKLLLTPTLKNASNDNSRAQIWELLAQQISGYVEPKYISDDMLRGTDDEVDVREIYSDNYESVIECGFITNDKWGFTLGYSPDGLVGDDGLIEIKSRRQKYQIQTIVGDEIPAEYMLQLQAGLLVAERQWIDFISYRDGLPLYVKRVYPDLKIQAAIIEAAAGAYEQINALKLVYAEKAKHLIPTDKKEEMEILA